MKRVAANLGMTVAEVMIILKDQMENFTSTICIASKINNSNGDIQEVATKMKTILGDQVFSQSLIENTKPAVYFSALHANYGRGKIEEKYDAYTTAYHPGMLRVASSLLQSPAPRATVEDFKCPKESKQKFTAQHSDKLSCPSFLNILSNHDSFVEYYIDDILVGRLHIKAGFLLVYTTEIHTDNNKIFNPLKLVHCLEGASDCLLYCFIGVPPKEGLKMKGRAWIQKLKFAIETIFANRLNKL